jgi:hypothetical protein
MLIVVVIAVTSSLAAAQGRVGSGTTVVVPPRPMAAIEFLQEAGVERWQVKLAGENFAIERAYLRISGLSCTQMDEVYRGLITPLYDDMTFKTKSGKTCTVQAIER